MSVLDFAFTENVDSATVSPPSLKVIFREPALTLIASVTPAVLTSSATVLPSTSTSSVWPGIPCTTKIVASSAA